MKTLEEVIEKGIRTLLSSYTHQEIANTADISEECGLDSLDELEFVMAIEEKFDIEIPDDSADEIKSIHDIIEYIKENQ